MNFVLLSLDIDFSILFLLYFPYLQNKHRVIVCHLHMTADVAAMCLIPNRFVVKFVLEMEQIFLIIKEAQYMFC